MAERKAHVPKENKRKKEISGTLVTSFVVSSHTDPYETKQQRGFSKILSSLRQPPSIESHNNIKTSTWQSFIATIHTSHHTTTIALDYNHLQIDLYLTTPSYLAFSEINDKRSP